MTLARILTEKGIGGAVLPITFVASSVNTGVSAVSISIPRPLGTIDGDLMLIVLTSTAPIGAGVPSAPSDWTRHATTSTGSYSALWSKIATSEGDSYTCTNPGETRPLSGVCLTYRNAKPDIILEATPTSPTITYLSLSTYVADQVMLCIAGSKYSNAGLTAPTGTTQRVAQTAASNTSISVFDEMIHAIGPTGDRVGGCDSNTSGFSMLLLPTSALDVAPQYIGVSPVVTTPNSATLSLALPIGTTNGDLLVTATLSSATATWTCPAGWTEVLDGPNRPNTLVAWKIATNEVAPINFVATGTPNLRGCMMGFRSAVFDVAGVASTNATAVSISTTGPRNILIDVYGNTASVSAITPPSSMMPVITPLTTAPAFALFSQLVGTGATGSRTIAGSVGDGTGSVLFDVKRSS